nr:MAG TPA: replication protein O [Caudoviricetes sp.]
MTAPVSRLSNSFTMANAIVDLDLRHMSGNALKCYVVIVRKTTGWNKVTDRISIKQFMDFSGIERRETVSKALRELEAMGLIVRHERSGRITEYSLNFEEPTHTDKPSYPDEPTHPDKPSDTHTDKPSDTPPKKPYTTKDTVTKDTVTKDTRLGARATAAPSPENPDPPPAPPPHAKPKRQSREEAFVAFVVERGVDEETARCWWQYRDGKPMTSKAWERHCAQADAAGISPQAAADYTAGREWRAFYADGYLREMTDTELARRQSGPAPAGRVFDQAGNPQGGIVPAGMPQGRTSQMSKGLAIIEQFKKGGKS